MFGHTTIEQLNLEIYTEEVAHWQYLKKAGLRKFHFLVLHLSFIESLIGNDENKYGEANVAQFIKEQILTQEGVGGIDDNFILVITTGRGRSEWWDSINNDKKLSHFTTFKPIEAIVSSVDAATQINDDFDLKHNIVKVLFGS